MKNIYLLIAFIVTLNLSAQTNAITENGDEVFLYDDGTWRYINDSIASIGKNIELNTKSFNKDKKSTFLIKSNISGFGVYINPKKWKFSKSTNNDEAEFEFQLKNEDLYGMILVEKVEIPIENLGNIALDNAKEVSPDIEVVEKEYRIVNGKKMLFMQLNGTMQGIKFSYYGYYYSNTEGSVQFITYTSQNLLNTYKEECELLVNGLVEIEE